MEIPEGFRVIEDFPDYIINREGLVKNRHTGYILLSVRETSRYVKLRRRGQTYDRTISRLLRETFGI